MPWRWKQLKDHSCDQEGVAKHQCKTSEHVEQEKTKVPAWLNDLLQPLVDVPGWK
jgi:hypothetical protein